MAKCSIHKLISGVVVTAGRNTLLVKYKDTSSHDGQTGWFHPDDTLTDYEEPQEGALRILKEQLGLRPNRVAFGLFESFKGHDRTHHLMFHYRAHFPKGPAITPSANIAVATWFQLDRMPPKSAFAHQGWSRDVIEKLTKSGK